MQSPHGNAALRHPRRARMLLPPLAPRDSSPRPAGYPASAHACARARGSPSSQRSPACPTSSSPLSPVRMRAHADPGNSAARPARLFRSNGRCRRCRPGHRSLQHLDARVSSLAALPSRLPPGASMTLRSPSNVDVAHIAIALSICRVAHPAYRAAGPTSREVRDARCEI